MIGPWVNTAVEMVKGSSLLAIIGVVELLLATKQVIAGTYIIPFYLTACVIYFVFNFRHFAGRRAIGTALFLHQILTELMPAGLSAEPALLQANDVHKRFGSIEVLKGVRLVSRMKKSCASSARAAPGRPHSSAASTYWRSMSPERSGLAAN
jgi:hypothetical protein